MRVFVATLFLAALSIHATPSPSEWALLAQSLGEGKLVSNIRPPAAPCHKPTYDASKCAFVVANWQNSTWRSSQIGAMQNPLWEQLDGHWCDIAVDVVGNPTNSTSPIPSPCPQGNIPLFGVNASTPQDVLKAVQFANNFSVPLIVKGTGHDYLGRSSEPDRLLIWTHNMKNTTYGSVQLCGEDHSDTLTIAAGVQWGEAYRALAPHQRVVPGGGDPDVGASGGQMMGGGHSPLANTYGLTPDSVIQLEVITLDGVLRVVNQCTNEDLFWALRGGGGGTYAIVTSTTYRTYLDAPTAVAAFAYNDTGRGYSNVLDVYGSYSPQLAEMGWSGYLFNFEGAIATVFFLPLINNVTFQEAADTWTPVFKALNETKGVAYVSAVVSLLPSAQDFLSGSLTASPTGGSLSLGSRLIPKAILQNPTERSKLTSLLASVSNISYAFLVSGGAPSQPSNSAVLPAWRKAVWHFITLAAPPVDAPNAVIGEFFKNVTETLEPIRQATPGSGAYMNEADARAPAWKDDFFGENYDKLLTIKKKWDPKGLLHCNRCVGSDE